MKTIDTTLSFRGAHGVRVLGTNEAPLFVASDVCKILGIKDHHDAVKKLPASCRGGRVTSPTPSGMQEMSTVNEAGLYRLIFRSRKKEAEEFQEWVTSEVLPAIRRTGSYSTSQAKQINGYPDMVSLFEAAANALRSNQNLSSMLSQIIPADDFGSISPSSGQPRLRLMPAYFTSRWPRDHRTVSYLDAQSKQMLLAEIMEAATERLGLSA